MLHKGFLILWASAIFWFYLGNLINFHQNRIWGKYLIPSCFTHSSVNKEDFASFQIDDSSTLVDYSDVTPQLVNDLVSELTEPVLFVLHSNVYSSEITTTSDPFLSATLLRGPPVA